MDAVKERAAGHQGGLKALPHTLFVLFIICLAVPVWSIVRFGTPEVLMQERGAWTAVLMVAAYWILPVAIAGAVWKRHVIFVPLFLTECLALALYVGQLATGRPESVAWASYLVIGAAFLIGIVVSSHDIVVPFYNKQTEHWRGVPRLAAHIRTHVRLSGNARPVVAIVEDFSVAGLAVSMSKSHAAAHEIPRKGDVLTVLSPSTMDVAVACEIVWARDDGPLQSYGLKAQDPAAMGRLVADLSKGVQRGLILPFWVGRLWINPGFRHTLTVIWAVTILAAFGLPS